MRHISVLRQMEGVRVTAVPTRPERVAELLARGITALPSLQDALQDQPAGVVVATDSGRHAGDAEACLAICPVLVEKPMTPSLEQARRLVMVASSSGNALHVGCCLRFDAGLAWARDRLEAVGRPHLLDVECLSWLPAWRPQRDLLSSYSARPGEGGVLLDLIHEIDSCFWFAGPWQTVVAQTENRGLVGLPEAVEETAIVLGRHSSGLSSSVRLSYAIGQATRRLRLWGSNGALAWDGIKREARRMDSGGAQVESFSWSGPEPMYRAQMDAWVGTLRGDASDRLVDAAHGAYEVAVCETARRSQTTGRREDVPWLAP